MANESDWLELRCPAVAHPPPEREWRWEGIRIDGTDDGTTARGGGGDIGVAKPTAPAGQFVHMGMSVNGSLIIQKVSPMHAGAYECHVSNMAGDDRIQYSLKVVC